MNNEAKSVIVLLLTLFVLLGSIAPVPAQACHPFQPGDAAHLVSDDAFNGQTVQVIQPATYQDGTPAWLVEVIRTGQPRPFGYLGATNCDLLPVN